ncbi:MAG: hypothetical protein R3C45_14885 [Phycisphaerales bacterium]
MSSHHFFRTRLPAVWAVAVLVLAQIAPSLAADTTANANLNRPAKRLVAPKPNDNPDITQHTIALDPAQQAEGITLSPDGRSAFLVIRQTPAGDAIPESETPNNQDAGASIMEIDLDTGQTVAVYEIPEPFAFKQPEDVNMPAPRQIDQIGPPINPQNQPPHNATRPAIARLAVSPDGRSLVACIEPPHTRLQQAHGLDAQHAQDTFFFRWDTFTHQLTHQTTIEKARPDWRFRADNAMLLLITERKQWSIESWGADDLSRTVLISQPTSIHIELDASTTDLSKVNFNDLMKLPPPPVAMPNCAEYDEPAGQVTTLLILPPPPSMKMTRPRMTYRLRHFDIASGAATGDARQFVSDGSLQPVMLRGQRLLLREQPPHHPKAPVTFHLWDTQQQKHLAAIQSTSRDAALTDDGLELQLGNQRLDLTDFKWRPAWPRITYSRDTASTPDGRRKVEVTHDAPNDTATPVTLTVSDIR